MENRIARSEKCSIGLRLSFGQNSLSRSQLLAHLPLWQPVTSSIGLRQKWSLYLRPKAAVIDFGLLAIGNLANFQQGVWVGDFVNGEISIGLPLCIEPIPDAVSDRMSHRWEVSRISADLTPYQNGRRDKTRISYTDVTSTEETKAFDYLLHCKEVPPSESRTPETGSNPLNE